MKTGPSADLCYDRGYIYVAFNREGGRVIRQGPLGREQETIIKKGNTRPFKGELNRHSCRWRERPQATQSDHGVIEALRDDHGYIEAERPWDRFPTRQYFLVRPASERIPIDFHGGAGGPLFSEFRQAYVYQESYSVFSSKVERYIWLISLDGKVVAHKLPAGKWMEGSTKAMPVRSGVFMSSTAVWEAAGGYLIKGEKIERVIRGNFYNFAVSPNGCKVSMSIQPDVGVVSRAAVINVCRGDT